MQSTAAYTEYEDILEIDFGLGRTREGRKFIVLISHQIEKLKEPHLSQWLGFLIQPTEIDPNEEKFEKWHRRYVRGDWSVDNDTLFDISQLLRAVNAVTLLFVGLPLYSEFKDEIHFPVGDNTHQYENAHRELYRYLVDGVNRDCLIALSKKLNITVSAKSDLTLKVLSQLFPQLVGSRFKGAMDNIVKHRSPAAHKPRETAKALNAHEAFETDLQNCRNGIQDLLGILEGVSGLNHENCVRYMNQQKFFPEIGELPQPNYSICQADKLVGKTIEKVEYGFAKRPKGVHVSEVLLIYFTDGSKLGIDTGSNAENLCTDENKLEPDGFHVRLDLTWVDPL